MGRIKGRKPEETREAVLEAATKAFAERGFANATLGMIAKRAGVTAATLPYHFGDKQGLYDAVIEGIYTDLIGFGRDFGSVSSFEQVIERVYGWAEGHRDGIRVMIRTVIEGGTFDTRTRNMRIGPTIDLVSRMVAAHFGAELPNARNAVVTLTHLVTRFLTNSVEDNLISLAVQTEEEARDRILGLLVSVGKHLLAID